MFTDYVLDGQGHGSVGSKLQEHGFDFGALRPYYGKDGRSQWITTNRVDPKDGVIKAMATPVRNNPATLPRLAWTQMDDLLIKEALPPMQAWADLRGSASVNIPNAMGTLVYQYQQQVARQNATLSIDGDRVTDRDRFYTELKGIPLPILHSDWWFGMREMEVARRGGQPLDLSAVEWSGRAMGEQIERMTVGSAASFTYAGVTIYGYTSSPTRLTASVTLPTTSGWTPKILLEEILAMRKQSTDQNFYGPWVLYFSPYWDQYLDNDFSDAKGDVTLRERILKAKGIVKTETLQFLTGQQILMVQFSATTARALIGMDLVTMSWPSQGDMRMNYKAMAILVPQIRADAAGQTGIVHATGV